MLGVGLEEAEESLVIRAISVHDEIVGDPATLGPVAEEIATAARGAGDREALVVALRAMAWAERLQLRNIRALKLLDEAATHARHAALPHRLGEVLVSRAAVNLELGRTRVAVHDLDRAGVLVDAAGAPELGIKRGVLLSKVGRLAEARSAYLAVLNDPNAGVDVRSRAANNLAIDAATAGRVRDALYHIDLACELAAQVGPALVALVAQNRGLVLTQCGKLSEGLRQLDSAVAALAAVGLPLGEAYAESAETLAVLRALPEARDLAARAVAEARGARRTADGRRGTAEARGDRAADGRRCGGATRGDGRRGLFDEQKRRSWVAMATVVVTEARASRRHADQLRRRPRLPGRRHPRPARPRRRCGRGRAGRGPGGAVGGPHPGVAAEADVGVPAVAASPVLVRLQGRLAAALAAQADGDDQVLMQHCRAGLDELAAPPGRAGLHRAEGHGRRSRHRAGHARSRVPVAYGLAVAGARLGRTHAGRRRT